MEGFLVRYQSTRGSAPVLGFRDVLLTGLAEDGGLYLPESWPQLSAETISSFAGKPFAETAQTVLEPFVAGEIEPDAFAAMIDEAYSGFRHAAVVPLVQTGTGEWILELFHGPTLAFKDVAMQLLARLMDHVLEERSQRATIVGATSGDTGGAAIEAFGGRDRTDIFILFPEGKVSPVQQRQMTTSGKANVHPLAVKGNFDDCQALIKAMFNDQAFRKKSALSGVNSINWARIMAQIVYYFSSAADLGAPHQKIAFTVPTGNFGDIFAGYAASRMGLPIGRLVVATNENDILARTLETGRYEVTGVHATSSPSMDIQVSSNFERLLYEACARDDSEVKRMMNGLAQSGAFTLPDDCLSAVRKTFSAGRTDEKETATTIRKLLESSDYLADPHTAVGLHVARKHQTATQMVTLSTAHPAKFPDAVELACGIRPQLPKWANHILEREEKFETIPNDLEKVQQFVLSRSRAAN